MFLKKPQSFWRWNSNLGRDQRGRVKIVNEKVSKFNKNLVKFFVWFVFYALKLD